MHKEEQEPKPSLPDSAQSSPASGAAHPTLPPINITLQTQPADKHWKDNHLVVAGVVAVATATFWHTVVTPNHSEATLVELRQIKKELKEIEATNEFLTTRATRAESQLQLNELVNLFKKGDPYPYDRGSVRIGDPVSRLREAYSDQEVVDSKLYFSVDFSPSSLETTYYFDRKSPNREITHLLISSKSETHRVGEKYISRPLIGANVIKQKLTEALGQPKIFEKEGQYYWELATENIVVYLKDDSDSYLIMRSGYSPGSWSD